MALFITFEGLDGSGKSTHVERVADWLTAAAVPFVVTREPGGTELGNAIRRIFLDRHLAAADGTVELLMVFAARRQHLIEVVEPALAAGRHVLCDRFTDSTIAYQGYGRGVDLGVVDAVDALATGRRRPDRTLLFDLPPELARKRGHSKHRRRAGAANRIDAEGVGFYGRVSEGYRTLARREPGRFRIVDSSQPLAATELVVRAALSDLLPEPTA